MGCHGELPLRSRHDRAEPRSLLQRRRGDRRRFGPQAGQGALTGTDDARRQPSRRDVARGLGGTNSALRCAMSTPAWSGSRSSVAGVTSTRWSFLVPEVLDEDRNHQEARAPLISEAFLKMTRRKKTRSGRGTLRHPRRCRCARVRAVDRAARPQAGHLRRGLGAAGWMNRGAGLGAAGAHGNRSHRAADHGGHACADGTRRARRASARS